MVNERATCLHWTTNKNEYRAGSAWQAQQAKKHKLLMSFSNFLMSVIWGKYLIQRIPAGPKASFYVEERCREHEREYVARSMYSAWGVMMVHLFRQTEYSLASLFGPFVFAWNVDDMIVDARVEWLLLMAKTTLTAARAYIIPVGLTLVVAHTKEQFFFQRTAGVILPPYTMSMFCF
jgi:hypothetical protein